MLAGPRFGAIARPTDQHVRAGIALIELHVSGNLVGNSVVNLEVALLQLPEANLATATVLPRQAIPEFLRESASPAEETTADFGEVGKPVGGDAPSIATLYPECLEGNSLIPYVLCSPGRMVVPILVLKFLGRNVTVLQDMLDDSPGSLVSNGANPFKELFG
jgi:hypothetical protein